MNFIKRLLRGSEQESALNTENYAGIPRSEQVDQKAIQRFFRQVKPQEIGKILAKGSPRPMKELQASSVDFVDDLQRWKEFAEQMRQANSIIVCGHHDGLGDAMHHIRYATALALQYPDKKIYHLVRNPEYFDEHDLPDNVELVKANPKEPLVTAAQTSPDTVVFNPSLFQPLVRSQFGGKDSQFVFAETQRGRDGWDLFSAWYYTAAKTPQEPANKAVRAMRAPTGENTYYMDSSHQIIDQASKLKLILGVDIPDNFAETPIREPRPISNRADVVIISDAAEGGEKKLINPQKWAEYVVQIWRERPGTKISLVRGVSHPELVEKIMQEIPDACKDPSTGKVDFSLSEKIITMLRENIFSGDLQRLYDFTMAAQVVVSVDTGPGHAINEGIRKFGDTLPTPKLISLIGSKPFNPLYYRLDCADTLIANGLPDTLEIDAVSDLSLQYLQ